jgi:hypothetical protein
VIETFEKTSLERTQNEESHPMRELLIGIDTGSSAAFAEMNAAVHGLMFATRGRERHEAFNYVKDAGHAENGAYALRAANV